MTVTSFLATYGLGPKSGCGDHALPRLSLPLQSPPPLEAEQIVTTDLVGFPPHPSYQERRRQRTGTTRKRMSSAQLLFSRRRYAAAWCRCLWPEAAVSPGSALVWTPSSSQP